MRCLLCDRILNQSFRELFFSGDPLCEDCRRQLQSKKIKFHLEGVELQSDYVYDAFYSKLLRQYKETGDYVLKNVFLYGLRWKLWRRYRGYTMVYMPSRQAKNLERGFFALREIFKSLPLEQKELFMKTGLKDQKELSFQEREKVGSNICFIPGITLPKKILIVDDTITSGASLKALLNLLKGKNLEVKIYCISVNRRWLE